VSTGIGLDFRIEITGSLDETGDEAEVSARNNSLTMNSEKVLNRNKEKFISIRKSSPIPVVS